MRWRFAAQRGVYGVRRFGELLSAPLGSETTALVMDDEKSACRVFLGVARFAPRPWSLRPAGRRGRGHGSPSILAADRQGIGGKAASFSRALAGSPGGSSPVIQGTRPFAHGAASGSLLGLQQVSCHMLCPWPGEGAATGDGAEKTIAMQGKKIILVWFMPLVFGVSNGFCHGDGLEGGPVHEQEARIWPVLRLRIV